MIRHSLKPLPLIQTLDIVLSYITQANEVPFANGVLVESLELYFFSIVRVAHAAVFQRQLSKLSLDKTRCYVANRLQLQVPSPIRTAELSLKIIVGGTLANGHPFNLCKPQTMVDFH